MRELELVLTNPDLNPYVLKNYFFRFKPKALLTYLCSTDKRITIKPGTEEEFEITSIPGKAVYKDIIIFEDKAWESRETLLGATDTFYTRHKLITQWCTRRGYTDKKVDEIHKQIDKINYDTIAKMKAPVEEKTEFTNPTEKRLYEKEKEAYDKFLSRFNDKNSNIVEEILSAIKNKNKAFLSKQEIAWLDIKQRASKAK